MNARCLAVAALALAAGCGSSPPQTTLRVDIFNDEAASLPRPTTVLLSWLDMYGFLLRDRAFTVPPGTGSYLGDVVVRIYVADASGPRSAFVRGQVGDQVVSEGWGMVTTVKDQAEPPLEIKLVPFDASHDADGDTVPDAIDNCPGLPNPEQKNTDC